jgi:hypothetical protein
MSFFVTYLRRRKNTEAASCKRMVETEAFSFIGSKRNLPIMQFIETKVTCLLAEDAT